MAVSTLKSCFFLVFFFCSALPAQERIIVPSDAKPFALYTEKDRPFWKKESVRRSLAQREILVSVTSRDQKLIPTHAVMKQLYLRGAGWINAPFAVVRERILQFQELRKIAPDNFNEIKVYPERNQLFIHGVAMGWHARMNLQLYQEAIKDGHFRLHWKVISGSFDGLVGYFELENQAIDQKRRTVEFSMTGFYQSEKLPLPSFLLSFGLETVMRVVATRLRTHLESNPGGDPGTLMRLKGN